MPKARESFSRWVNRRKLAFGLLTRKTATPRRDEECLRVTRRNLALHNAAARNHFLEGPDIDAMLRSAYLSGYDYILIQAAGSYLLDKPGIRDALEDEMQSGFFVLGHVLDRGEAYYTLHRQCLCVNLAAWTELGQPRFGQPGKEPRRLHRPRRSDENFHDRHTPIWIEPSGEQAEYPRQLAGWNFIHAGLTAGLRIAPFSQRIRHRKAYLYPENEDDYYFRVGEHRRRALAWSEGAWVANTERPPVIRASDFAGPVSTMISVASGLNTYLLLARLGYDDSTAVHYVDSSRATLEFKRWLLENWDGKDYPAAIDHWRRDQAHLDPQRGLSEADIAATAADIQTGLEGSFAKHWKAFRRLPHQFHRLDLLTSEHERMLKLIDPASKTTLLWFSNVFHSAYTHAILAEEENATLFRFWIEKLRRRNPQVYVIGRDHLHDPIAARVGDLTVNTSPDLPTNLYYPAEVLDWFAAEAEQLRKVRRR
jgi:hypothetical protein